MFRFIYFLLSIVASTLPEVNIASGLLCQTSNIVFCSLRMKNFRIIPFFLTLAPNQPDHCSAPNTFQNRHTTLYSAKIFPFTAYLQFSTHFLVFSFRLNSFHFFRPPQCRKEIKRECFCLSLSSIMMTRLVLQFWLLGLQLCSAPGLIMNSSSGLCDKD